MNEVKRFRAYVGVVATVLICGGAFIIVSGAAGGDNWAMAASIAILATMAAVAIIFTRRWLRDLRSGYPREDERSVSIRMRAGYFAFYVSLFLLFGLSIALAILEENQVDTIPSSEWMMVYVAVMGSVFLALHYRFKRKGAPG